MLADDKARNECEARLNIDKTCGEVGDNKRTLEELRFLVDQKSKINQQVGDELCKSKNLLGEKCMDAHKTREEAHCKGHEVDQDRARLSALQSEIESVKNDRATACREIVRLQEIGNQKACEASELANKLHCLNCELGKMSTRVEDLTKIIQIKSDDLSRKQAATAETQCELFRTRDSNKKSANDLSGTNSCVEILASENCEARKELSCLEQRNAELCCTVSKAEDKLKCNEAGLFCTQQEVECLRKCNCDYRQVQQDKCCEKDALTNHVQVLTGQNHDLTQELNHFVEQDEILRH